jgi:hypothetical protein
MVSTLGSGVSGVGRRVETNDDIQRNVYQLTYYDAASAGYVVNQIQRGYNDLEQLTTEYQTHQATSTPARRRRFNLRVTFSGISK